MKENELSRIKDTELKEETKLEKAFNNYHAIIEKGLPHKFTDLENWILKKSNLLLYESHFPKRTYHRFKRGSIVRVDFGVNIGSEFSQYHFAIVISKKDDIYKDLITVVPLTSKSHPQFTIPLDDLIIRNFIKNAVREISRIELRATETKEKKINILAKLKEYDSRKEELTIEEQKEYQELISQLSTLSNDEIQYQKESEELLDIVELYSGYSNISHACVSQIKVISKTRVVKPINKFDIVEKAICSEDLMKRIDMEIIKRNTGIDFAKFSQVVNSLYTD